MIKSYFYYPCAYDIYLTLPEAEACSGISVAKWQHQIERGVVIPAIETDVKLKPSQVMIHINYLPKPAAEQYLREHLLRDSFLSVDFVGYLHRNGEAAFEALLKELEQVKAFLRLNAVSGTKKQAAVRQFCSEVHLSPATMYRKEALILSSELKKLVNSPKVYHSQSLCALTEHFIIYHLSLPNAGSQAHILRELIKEALALGRDICNRCPFNPVSANHARLKKKYPEMIVVCQFAKNGLVVPETRYPINRFVQSLNRQQLFYGRKGYNAWADTFLHKTIRDRPLLVNAVWFGDHHLADVMVIVGYDKKTKEPLLARPWLTVFTDAATEAIVGSVVSVHPNAQTIMEAFARGAAFSVEGFAYGLPLQVYIDNGYDFRSKLIEGSSFDFWQKLPQTMQLNKVFCEHPLLPALNVTVHHALPRTGRSKVIERVFGTVTREWLRFIPGWLGNCPSERPFDYYREQKKLLKEEKLWTLEQFARDWFERIVPAYNSFVSEATGQSPLQLYQTLPRANTIVPDWNTLSVLMTPKCTRVVQPQGIKYRNEVYWHPFLQQIIGNRVSIYDFDQCFYHSLSVLYNGRYLCEAEPLVHQAIIEQDRLKLMHHLEEQKLQTRRISKKVTAVRQILQSANISTDRYQDAPQPETAIAYAEAIDTERDRLEATVLSAEANQLAMVRDAQQKAIEAAAYGPKETPVSDYYRQKAKARREKENEPD